MKHFFSVLLFLFAIFRLASSLSCAAGSYGTTSCLSCPESSPFSLAGSFSIAQCHPFAYSGPTDTVFSFYGTTAEVLSSEYTITGPQSTLTSVTDAFGNSAAALSMTGAAYLMTVATRPELPIGTAARTTSVWI